MFSVRALFVTFTVPVLFSLGYGSDNSSTILSTNSEAKSGNHHHHHPDKIDHHPHHPHVSHNNHPHHPDAVHNHHHPDHHPDHHPHHTQHPKHPVHLDSAHTHHPYHPYGGPWYHRPLCYKGWTYHQGYCYVMGTDTVTWANAEFFCQQYGANLAQVDSRDENEFLKNLARKHKAYSVWLGATDIFSEAHWIWLHSKFPVGPFSDWIEGQPNNEGHSGGEDCLQLLKSHDYKWNDADCNKWAFFVCEKRLYPYYW